MAPHLTPDDPDMPLEMFQLSVKNIDSSLSIALS